MAHSTDNPGLRRSYELNNCSDGLDEGDVTKRLDDEDEGEAPLPEFRGWHGSNFEPDFASDYSRSTARWENAETAMRTRMPTTMSTWRPRVKAMPTRFPDRFWSTMSGEE